MPETFHSSEQVKVFILYLLEKIGYPLEYNDLASIVLRDGYVDYFDFVKNFHELLEKGHIAPVETGGDEDGDEDPTAALNAEIARLKSDLAKQKSALDAATSEAGKYRKELKSKMTQEQIAESEKQEAAEKAAKELADLRKEVAKGKTIKSVMGKLGIGEEDAGELAEHLYGAENIETALLLIQKAWTAKEKALRLEFGKVPPPGAGGANGEDAEEQRALEMAKRMGQNRASNNQSVKDGLSGYMR